MAHTICGAECAGCPMESNCGGCAETGGRPFGTPCMLADCCRERGYTRCGECSGTPCGLQTRLLEEFNALGIAELEEPGINMDGGGTQVKGLQKGEQISDESQSGKPDVPDGQGGI